MTTTNNVPSPDTRIATDDVTSLLAEADLPVGQVQFVEPRGLEEALLPHQTDYIAEAWSRYKSAWHRVATEGGVDGEAVPSTVTTPLSQLDEEAVALALDAWRAGFQLAMAIAPVLPQGGVAIRLPETTVCPECRGFRVPTDRSNGRRETERDTDNAMCAACDGAGVVAITPDLLVVGGGVGVLPLPVGVVQT